MYIILGVLAGICFVSVVIIFNLSEKLKLSQQKETGFQKKEADLNIQLANFVGIENHFEKTLHEREANFRQIILEKEKNISEIKQQFARQLHDLKTDYENRLSRKKEDEDRLRESFSNIANQILEQKNKNLQEQSTKTMQSVLEPFKTDITNFKQLIHTINEQRTQQHASLETHIKSMQNVNQNMIQTAENLTKALKGDSKVQGNWGEMIVRNILDSVGFTEGQEYTEQGKGMNLRDETGKLQQPDFIIHLPNKKHIVLDSKVSLTHYERFCATENRDEIKGFLNSINTHIAGLSAKKYHENPQLNAPDFTMMFIPIESAYFLAVHEEADLYQKAWAKRIALVCPSTLLAMIQTIKNLWEIDMQNKNTQKIVERAKLMYDKFQGFVGSLDGVGKGLENAAKSFENAKKQLTEGRGNLDSQFKEMLSLSKLDTKKIDAKDVEFTPLIENSQGDISKDEPLF